MQEQKGNPDLNEEDDHNKGPRKFAMTYGTGLEVAIIMGIPLLIIILILKLAGC
jgi:hypothetical protein